MAYRVIHTLGLRGTAAFPAIDKPAAEREVKRIIATMIATDSRTAWQRIGQSDAWRITSGKYINDTIQVVTAEPAKPAAYNTQSDVLQQDKERAQLNAERFRRNRHWSMIVNAPIPTKNEIHTEPCRACNGTGKAVMARTRLVWSATPWQKFGTRPVQERMIVVCAGCNGIGRVE